MRITSRRGTIVFFVCLGIGLVALAVALNVGWIILNWREGVLLFFGVIFFALIIAGVIVNTWYGIWTLKTLGLAWDIKRVKLADLENGLVAAPNGRLVTAPLAEGAAAGD
jgi:hypothetical protein